MSTYEVTLRFSLDSQSDVRDLQRLSRVFENTRYLISRDHDTAISTVVRGHRTLRTIRAAVKALESARDEALVQAARHDSFAHDPMSASPVLAAARAAHQEENARELLECTLWLKGHLGDLAKRQELVDNYKGI